MKYLKMIFTYKILIKFMLLSMVVLTTGSCDRYKTVREKLKELQKEQSELAKPIKDVIKSRLDLLNGLLAKEITNNDRYAEPYNKWIDTVRNDKKKFMDSTRLAFAASHPKFMEYLEQHRLSTDEINYLCLYAIGLRGKEVGEYTQMKRHYIVSHEIRKKLCIDGTRNQHRSLHTSTYERFRIDTT